MKRLIIILVAGFIAISSRGQVKQEVIASAGGYNANGNLSISWTLGETVIPTFTYENLTLSHGFQQQLFVTAIEENLDLLVNIRVYPNPASEYINVQFEEPLEEPVAVSILDSQGRLVKSAMIEAAISEKLINMQDLAAGLYYLRLTKGKLVNVYKVVKL